MQSFELLSQKFTLQFEKTHFPAEPASLYEPNEYFLKMGGKRIRPVLCLMGNDYLNKIDLLYLHNILHLFNQTAREVCEGQQTDMVFERKETVSLEEYLHMIGQKT